MTKIDRDVLKSLVLDGPANIQEIHERIKQNYPSTRRSIRKLELGHVWHSNTPTNGPKSPQEYRPTSIGILGAFVNLDLTKHTKTISKNYPIATPMYIKYYPELVKAGIKKDVDDALRREYALTLPLLDTDWHLKDTDNDPIDCNVINHNIILEFYNKDETIIKTIYDIVKNDEDALFAIKQIVDMEADKVEFLLNIANEETNEQAKLPRLLEYSIF